MKKEILKIAGVKSEKEFYKKFPDEASFMAKHGKAFKKAQIGAYIGGEQGAGFQPISFNDIYDEADYALTGSKKDEKETTSQQISTPKVDVAGLTDSLNNIVNLTDSAIGSAKNGKGIKKAFFGEALMSGATKAFGAAKSIKGADAAHAKDIAGKAKTAIPYVGDLIEGFQMLKAEKDALRKAEQAKGVSDVALLASRTRPEETQRRYVRPEDMVTAGNERFPVYGRGTNPLARNGAEIANTFAPNTLYDDLGYEPLNDSEEYEQFKKGGNLPKAQGGFVTNFASAGGGDYLSDAVTAIGGENAGGKIGGTVGKAAGSLIGGEVGGMIGQVGGQIIGGLIDRKPAKIKKAKKATTQNMQSMALGQGIQGVQQQNVSYMEEGGWISNDWQPQVIAKFGDYDMKDLLKKDPMMNTLRSGGHLKAYTPPSERAMSTERPIMEEGGELQTHWGGYAEPMSYNPYLPEGGETIMFRGQSHEESDGKGNTGIGITYGDSPVEVERGEPAIKMKDGSGSDSSLVVFGNLKIPHTLLGDPDAKGKNFKKYVAELSKKENKYNKLMEKSTDQLDESDLQSSYDKLKFNSLEANIMGANMGLKTIAQKKMDASALQTAMNDTIEEQGLETSDRGVIKAEKGANVPKAQDGKSLPRVSVGDYKYLKDLYDKAKKAKKGPDVLKFQQEYHRLAAPYAKKVIGKDDLKTNEDSIFGKRTAKYMQTLDNSMKNVSPLARAVESAVRPAMKHTDIPMSIPTTLKAPSQVKLSPSTKSDDLVEDEEINLSTYLNQALPFLRPTDIEDLDPSQLMGEMFALSQNQLEPVQAQLFQPELSAPYEVSLQDILNENEATFRAQQRLVGYNPAFQSQLAAQKYSANQKVLGEQFRMNQAMRDQVYKENRDLLNQAKLQNLGILDQQYQRQAQARSATKATAQEALNSIASKYAQNKLENRTLQVYENMYNYRFDPNFRAMNMNPLADFQAMIENASPDELSDYAKSIEQKTKTAKSKTARNGSIVKALKNI